ncbi:hypothetical protein BH10PSE11_BH10PSE11_08300 [soil metagenome]
MFQPPTRCGIVGGFATKSRTIYPRPRLRLNAGMSILSFFRRTKSKYADDKAVEQFTRVLETVNPSAFDVAMEETRKSKGELCSKIENDLNSQH